MATAWYNRTGWYGQKPAQIAAFHIFIRDRAAYDKESSNAFLPLKEETARLMQSAVAVFSDMRVKAVA